MTLQREWELYGCIVPASVTAAQYQSQRVAGRERTSYFYRKQAIGWLRNMRLAWTAEMRATCKSLALSYLASFKKAKGIA